MRGSAVVVAMALIGGCGSDDDDTGGNFPAVCQDLVDACHEPGEAGDAAAEACHEIGHTGDEAACDASHDSCLATCEAAAAA